MTARRQLKSSFFSALSIARVQWLLRALYARDQFVLILNFHRVSPHSNPYWPPLTPEAFEALVAHLASSCHVLRLDELSRPPDTRKPRVVISFDDGYRDFVEYAAPVLARYRLRANHNVIGHSVDTGQSPWMTRVVDALAAASTDRVRAIRVPGFDRHLQGDDEISKTDYGTALTAYLKALTPSGRAAVSEDIEALLSETDPDRFTPMMSRSDVEAVATVHELGAHSYSHESCSQLSDAEFLADLDRCSAFFAELGRPMKIFAFPYGSFRPGQIETVRARGVEHVLLVGERAARTGTGVYTRITMYGDTDAELRLRAMGLPIRQLRGLMSRPAT